MGFNSGFKGLIILSFEPHSFITGFKVLMAVQIMIFVLKLEAIGSPETLEQTFIVLYNPPPKPIK